jgi:hypothetical protein
MVRNGKTAQGRLHALWTLHGLKTLRDEDVLLGLRDSEPGVRENAIKLAEPRTNSPSITEASLKMADDNDARVRFQLAFTLGQSSDPRAIDVLAKIAQSDSADKWTRIAILSSVSNSSDQLLSRVVANHSSRDLIRDLSQIFGARNKTEELTHGLEAARRTEMFGEVLLGLGEGLKRSGKNLRQLTVSPDIDNAINQALSEAQQTAADPNSAVSARLEAIHFLSFGNQPGPFGGATNRRRSEFRCQRALGSNSFSFVR